MLRLAALRRPLVLRNVWRRSVCYEHHDERPKIEDAAFCAKTASVVGEVELAEDASVWYNCVLRGDGAAIRIGRRTNIQDGSVVHVDSDRLGSRKGAPTVIGDDVTVGHMALIHAATLMDRSFVGMNATVMSHCTMEPDSMLAAGALLTGGKTVGSGELWGGSPAKFMRKLTPKEIAFIPDSAAAYVDFAKSHRAADNGAADDRH